VKRNEESLTHNQICFSWC